MAQDRNAPRSQAERPTPARWLLAATLLAVPASLGLASAGCTDKKAAPAAPANPAPEFETVNLDGEEVSLAELEGKVVLLNVWATWCDPCVREMPLLQQLHEELGPKGFTVVGLNADVRSKLPVVQRMVRSKQYSFPIWLDFESKAQVAFKLRGYPTSFLIDRKGNIRWKREGEILRNDPELMPVLEQVLAE